MVANIYDVEYGNIHLNAEGVPNWADEVADIKYNPCRAMCGGRQPNYGERVRPHVVTRKSPCLHYGHKPGVSTYIPDINPEDVVQALRIIIRETPMKDFPYWYDTYKDHVLFGTNPRAPLGAGYVIQYPEEFGDDNKKIIDGIVERFRAMVVKHKERLGRFHFGKVTELVRLHRMFDEVYKETPKTLWVDIPLPDMEEAQRDLAGKRRRARGADLGKKQLEGGEALRAANVNTKQHPWKLRRVN